MPVTTEKFYKHDVFVRQNLGKVSVDATRVSSYLHGRNGLNLLTNHDICTNIPTKDFLDNFLEYLRVNGSKGNVYIVRSTIVKNDHKDPNEPQITVKIVVNAYHCKNNRWEENIFAKFNNVEDIMQFPDDVYSIIGERWRPRQPRADGTYDAGYDPVTYKPTIK